MIQFHKFALCLLLIEAQSLAAEDSILAVPGKFHQLTEPPCSYCSNQQRKGLIRADDPVIAWVRGAHNGGAIPLRHFLAAPRVINDTYGLFLLRSRRRLCERVQQGLRLRILRLAAGCDGRQRQRWDVVVSPQRPRD